MSRLEKELDTMIERMERGGCGFGDPDGLRNFERKIEHLRFKITRRDTWRIALISALIGAVSAALVTFTIDQFETEPLVSYGLFPTVSSDGP